MSDKPADCRCDFCWNDGSCDKVMTEQRKRRGPNLTPLPCCGHPAGSHECGLCQVVLNAGDYSATPVFCQCPDNVYEESGMDEFFGPTTHNPSPLPVLSLFEEDK
jgi:hypothetical protein